MNDLQIALKALILSFAAFYLVRLLRVLPILQNLTEQGIKPLACNVCMSFWVSGILTTLFGGLEWVNIPSGLASAGLCLILLERVPEGKIELP